MADTKYTYSLANDTATGALNNGDLTSEIQASAIVIALKTIDLEADILDIWFKDALSTGDKSILDSLVSAHQGTPTPEEVTPVSLNENKTSDDILRVASIKSYKDSSRSFTTPDFSNPCTWFYDKTQVTGEVLTTSDNLTYSSTRDVTDWNHYWINWFRIPNNARTDFPENVLKVYKNGTELTMGYTIDYINGTVTFGMAQDPADVITVDYCYGNTAKFELSPLPGKKLLVDYVEVQFSVGCTFVPDHCLKFKAVYNGLALPPNALFAGFPGYPADTDLTLKEYHYYDADDFLNESTGVMVGEPFGRLSQKYLILPWNYLTGHTLKAPGDATTNLAANEFNKLVVEQNANHIVGNSEIATCTFYCKIEDA
jgi:hypothetical protein